MPILTISTLRRVTPPRVTRTAVEIVCPGGLEIRANGGDHEADSEDAEETSGAGGPLVFVRFDRAVDEAMPHLERQLAELRAVEPPAEDEESVAELLNDHEAALAAGAELVKAAAGGDRTAMATLESDDPVVEADRRVRDYGMTVCGGEG